MERECFVCGSEKAHNSVGGVLLCRLHYTAVMAEVDAIRATGQIGVNVAKIAYNMREPETPAQYAPSAEAVHSFLKRYNITGSEAARMMYLSGSRQVRKYTGGQKPRQMDGARWFCLHAHTLLEPVVVKNLELEMFQNLDLK